LEVQSASGGTLGENRPTMLVDQTVVTGQCVTFAVERFDRMW
jgi:hypothetical protein